jgi:23S rRNA pseudouridine1911/1915/1917 synthase
LRLDLALIRKHPGLSRRKAQAAILKGQVWLDGLACSEPGRAVTESSRLDWDVNRKATPRPQAVSFPVLFRDDHVLVIDKPAGILSVPAPGAPDESSVLGQLHEDLARGSKVRRKPFLGRIHRLDRDTSGALAFALSPEARRGLIALFKAHRIERRYLALVEGAPPKDEAVIQAAMADAYEGGRRRVARGLEAQSPALTRYRVRERFLGAALLEVEIETGRQHQIRVHLAYAGLPVLGDRVYREAYKAVAPRAPSPFAARRQMLHACRLGFAHPVTGEKVQVESEVPADLRLAIESLRRRGPARPPTRGKPAPRST